ncbi:MAG TPA: hypothetical protein DEB74_03175 [Lachnospiraceae bacterium]|nr:hypothetical protein [Lachnospiraceae bacterium]
MKKISVILIFFCFIFLSSCSEKKEKLIDLRLDHADNCTVYQNTHYEPTGIVVYAVYSNQTERDVTKRAKFDLISTNVLGKQIVNVSYQELTTQYYVEVIPQPEQHSYYLHIESLPKKLEYLIGETLDLDGLTINVIIDGVDSTLLHLGLCEILMFRYKVRKTSLDESGEYEIVVQTNYLGQDLTTSFYIEVIHPSSTVEKEYLAVDTTSAKLLYKVDEEFTKDGVKVMVKTTDGTQTTGIEHNLCKFSIWLNGREKTALDEAGIYTIRVAFNVLYCTYSIEVVNKDVVPSMVLDWTNTRFQYYVGEAFSSDGLDIKYYEDDVYIRSVDSKYCQFQFYLNGVEKYKLDEPGTYSVVVTFQGLSEDFKIAVIDR